MAIAFDAFSLSATGTTNRSWTHTPVGTPRGIFVFVGQSNSIADQVSGVTYGGVTMSRVNFAKYTDGVPSGDLGASYVYFLGAGIPTGAQTVAVTVSGANVKIGYCISYTAALDTEIQTSGKLEGTLTNPSGTLSLGGFRCAVAMAGMSGANNSGQITQFAGWTNRNETDPGASSGQILFCYSYDTIGTSDVTWGATQAATAAAFVGAAIKEIDDFIPIINYT